MSYVIRSCRPTDRDGVNRVARAAFAQYDHAYDDWAAFSEGIARMADLAAEADHVVAEQDGQVVGTIVHVGPGRPRSAIFPIEWSVIRMLVVDPAHRGQGIGSLLVAACMRCAIRNEAPVICQHTSPIMASALRLYTSLGFIRDRDLDPIRGVPYGRYVLPASRLPAALELLAC